jgi:MoaA/NifB/PqqE/SkfB family radical SAM enzyme
MKNIYPNIPEMEPRYGDSFDNRILYWGFFTKNEIIKNSGQLLMLDIDFGRECSLRCPTCFRRSNPVDDLLNQDLSYNEILSVIREAKDIGLREIKICGAGEPLENKKFLQFARHLTDMDIGLSIFTKGHVLGNDHLARDYFEVDGITDAKSLAKELYNLKTSLLVSCQSFYPDIQDKLVGDVAGYTDRRNRALEILVETGFNSCYPTRMALCTNPITKTNYSETLDIYKYARKRNIYPVVAALMVSGRQINERFLARYDVSSEEKIELFTEIYSYNIENNIQTLDQLLKDGISCLPGIHPCNQIAAGLYLTSNGNVLRCPGDSWNILGNIRDRSIKEIWRSSINYKLRGVFNCKCPPKDGITLPSQIYSTVLNNLKLKFQPKKTIKGVKSCLAKAS